MEETAVSVKLEKKRLQTRGCVYRVRPASFLDQVAPVVDVVMDLPPWWTSPGVDARLGTSAQMTLVLLAQWANTLMCWGQRHVNSVLQVIVRLSRAPANAKRALQVGTVIFSQCNSSCHVKHAQLGVTRRRLLRNVAACVQVEHTLVQLHL